MLYWKLKFSVEYLVHVITKFVLLGASMSIYYNDKFYNYRSQ